MERTDSRRIHAHLEENSTDNGQGSFAHAQVERGGCWTDQFLAKKHEWSLRRLQDQVKQPMVLLCWQLLSQPKPLRIDSLAASIMAKAKHLETVQTEMETIAKATKPGGNTGLQPHVLQRSGEISGALARSYTADYRPSGTIAQHEPERADSKCFGASEPDRWHKPHQVRVQATDGEPVLKSWGEKMSLKLKFQDAVLSTRLHAIPTIFSSGYDLKIRGPFPG